MTEICVKLPEISAGDELSNFLTHLANNKISFLRFTPKIPGRIFSINFSCNSLNAFVVGL